MNRSCQDGTTCYIGIDLGTTTTRVWLIAGEAPIQRLADSVGVGDSARDGHNDRLKATLRELIERQQDKASELGLRPKFVVGAGMITSALGLREIPHLYGPVGIEDLRNSVVTRGFPEVTSLPVRLVPGVKTGTPGVEAWEVGETDVIRGEETLCVGLLANGALGPNSMLLNLGSHWKAIFLDNESKISRCVTNLSGELMLAVQRHTILASSVVAERPALLDEAWVKHGIDEERRSGLVRALFCVRLLELEARTSPHERLSFLAGCFISQTLSALSSKSLIRKHAVICGAAGISKAWKFALSEYGIEAKDYAEKTEEAFIRGLSELSLVTHEIASIQTGS